ncbi:MobF family relaxase [Rhodococcus sp. IEGM 1408]|uniref:MobF family relaxase n=1 Tax=Rhodococcus sp. IEGM 1408 TaxID=3082220 RepID=UPI00295582F3|nr:MobF family relaxase [Rhodococcus sp. IEGM 1408]MDV8003116.1 MobF family relaxase [Rhodococcus sp. IEGM 1408]
MMSLRGVHAGTGYQYLLRSVATHDGPRESGQTLSDYYAAKGTPPGRWIGSGLEGLASQAVQSRAEVTEAQMAALYGEGLHPDTDEMLAAGTSLAGCKLGRAFPVYTADKPVLVALAAAEKQFRKQHNRLPTTSDRAVMAEQIGRPFYLEQGGYDHASGADVIAWVNRERDQVQQAVSGFDFTFSPVKSVSVLWALADEQTAMRIAAIHHEAVAEALAWAEDNAIYTRRGAGGIEQVNTRGIIASEFTHFDTRGGDPDLHSHVLLANKVQAPDGTWKSLDGQAIFQMHQVISARYDTALHDRLSREMGVEFAAHYPSPDKAPVWEIKGVDRSLIERFSSRRALARPVYEQLVAQYVADHGRQPSQRAGYALWQKAILDTRDAKKAAQSLAEHRAAWREIAVEAVGAEKVEGLLDQVRAHAHESQPRPVFDAGTHARDVAAQAIGAVTSRRAQFRRSHVDTAVSTVLKGFRFASDADRVAAHDQVMDLPMSEQVICLTPGEVLPLPQALTTASGAGIDARANAEKFTTRAVLDAEQTTLDAATTPVAVFAGQQVIENALARHEQDNGWALNDGQAALARHMVNAGTLVAAGVGPAGTGKSTAMAVVADAWRDTGRTVIGLAPSAAAASVLAEEIDAGCHTIDSLTFTWRGLHPSQPGKTLSALPTKIRRGDMLLVDEAGMSSTESLAALTEIAQQSGAVVRLIGDHKQLAAVETGGLFGEVARTPGTVQLDQVMRTGKDTEQAAATLALRDGDTDALTLYSERGWVRGGHREQMLTDAVGAYLADTAQGRKSLIIASRNADVDTMNEIIRADRIAAGVVDTSQETGVARGDTVGVGDVVIARKNQLLLTGDRRALGRVINGQMFTVTGLTDEGDLTVVDLGTGTAQLIPADYARRNVHLGYASTIHRAQGSTVETTHAVVDASVDRAGLYVAMTRGRHENRAYAVCEPALDPFAEDAHMHSAGDTDAPEPLEVLATVLGRDTRHRTATETLRTELDEATDPARVEGLYRHGVDLAATAFTAATLPDYLDALPRAHAHQLEADPEQYTILESAWTAAAKAGHDPREHWANITDDIDTASAPGALIASRLRHVTEAPSELPAPPPLTAGGDCELAAWLVATHAELTGGSDDDPTQAREAALEIVNGSRQGRLTDEQLEKNLQGAQASLKDHQAAHDRRSALSRQRDDHERQVRNAHRELDARVEAIEAARPLAENLNRSRQKLRQSQQQRVSAQHELGSLGRLAIRRRRELQDLLETTKVEHEMYTTEAQAWSDALARITPDPGPEHTWDDTVARAADTVAREQELAEAAQRDQPLLLSWDEQESAQAAHRLERAQRTLEELAAETTRREGLTDPQRELEQQVRQEEAERQSKKIRDASTNATVRSPGGPSAIEVMRRSYLAGLEADRATARDADTNLNEGGSFTSSKPGTGPDIGF